MRYFQSLKPLLRKKLTTSLIIIQLGICLLGFLLIIQVDSYYHSRYSIYTKLVDENNTLVVDPSSRFNTSNDMKKVIKKIFTLKDNGSISDIAVIKSGDETLNINNKGYIYHQLSGNILDRVNIKLDKGRMFNKDELDYSIFKTEIPIIIGSGLGEYLKLGDTIVCKNKASDENMDGEYEKIFKVIGIAKPASMYSFNVTSNFINTYIDDYAIYSPLVTWKYNLVDKSQDNQIIKKTILNQQQFNLKYEINGTKMVVYNNDYISALINHQFQIIIDNGKNIDTVKELCNQLDENQNIKFSRVKDMNTPIIEIYRQAFLGILIFTIVLFLFSILGIIGTTLYSIDNRKKEFGIRLTHGCTLNGIAVMVLEEIIFENIMAVLFVLVIFNTFKIYAASKLSKSVEFSYIINTDIKIFIYIILAITFTMIITSLIPIKKIMSLDIVELIRGK